MIKNLSSNSPLLTISPGSMPWINNQGLSVGNMRFNPGSQNVEVYDGINWIPLTNSTSIYLDPRLETVMHWALQRMEEETKIRQKAARHPSVADALAAYELAKEKLDVVAILCEQEENAQKAA